MEEEEKGEGATVGGARVGGARGAWRKQMPGNITITITYRGKFLKGYIFGKIRSNALGKNIRRLNFQKVGSI